MTVVSLKWIRKFDDISFENVNAMIKDTTAKDKEPYIINLLKSLFKLGVSIGIVKIDNSFRITMNRYWTIPEPGCLDIVAPDPEDPWHDTDVSFDSIESYSIIFFKNTVNLRLDYYLNDTCHELLDAGHDLTLDETLSKMINDANIIFNYREKRCLKWRTPLVFRYWFANSLTARYFAYGCKTII